MKQEVLIGQTDYTVLVKIRDDAGAPATGLTEASVDIAYARVETDNDVTTTDVAPAALSALTDAHTDWGFEEVSATDHPGLYRLDIADAVFASGAWSAVVTITGTGLDPADLEFVLVAFNPRDGVRLGLTALPNAAADAAGGLPISDAGGLDLDAQIGADIDAILVDTGTTLQAELDGIQADTEDIQSRLPTALGANGNMKADVRDSLGVAVTNSDFTVASATSTTVTLPSTYAGGGSLPDDDRYAWAALQVVAGTGSGQVVLLTTAAASARQYNVFAGTMPVQLDNTSECVVVGTWRGNAVALSDDATAADNLEAAADGSGYNLGGGSVVAASVTGAVGSVTGAVGSVTGNVGGNVTGSVGSLAAQAKADVNAEVAAIKAKTDLIPASPAAVGDIPTVSQIWTTALTESYAADGATFTGAQALYEICQSLTEFAISGTTLTVKKRDGSTTAATFTLDSATTPTSRTRAS